MGDLEGVEDTGLVTGVLAAGVAFFTGAVAAFAGVLAEVVTGVVFFVTAGGTAFLVPIGVRTGFAAGVVLEAGLPSLAGAALAGVVLTGIVVFVEAIGSGFLVPIGVLAFAGVDADFVAVEACVGVFFALSATFATPSFRCKLEEAMVCLKV
jgi:predicted membrane-bound spermidine synthase